MKKTSYVILLTLVLVCPLIVVGTWKEVHGATVPPSIISQDTTWTAANGPYDLSGPMLVASGATLTIQSGTTINLGTFYIQVNGTLSAIGTSATPVFFNSSTVNAGQIQFTPACTSWNQQTNTGCTIQNAVLNQTVVSITGCSVLISSNVFNDAAGMTSVNVAISTSYSTSTMTTFGTSTISNNQFNSCGLNLSDNSTVTGNVIQGGMGIYAGAPIISNNSISGGSSYFWIGRDWDRDYWTLAIEGQSSPTILGNTISSIAFNMNDNGMMYNVFNAQITSNTVTGTIGIGVGTGDIVISGNVVSGGIIGGGAATETLFNNVISNNNGIGLQIGDATVVNNTIINCQTAIQLKNAVAPTISGNNIQNYSQYSIQLVSTSNNISAANNWWGTTDQQAISQSIYDQKNDFNLGKVTFTPILTSANPSATAAGIQTTPNPSTTPTPTTIIITPTPSPSQSNNSTSTQTPASTNANPQITPSNTPATPEFSIMTLIFLVTLATVAGTVVIRKALKKPPAPP